MFNRVIQFVTGRQPSDLSKLEQQVSFCESCNEVCTADCRTGAALARVTSQQTFRLFDRY